MIISLREYSKDIRYFEKTDSTNNQAKLAAESNALDEHYLLLNVRQAAGDEEEEAGSHLREQEYG